MRKILVLASLVVLVMVGGCAKHVTISSPFDKGVAQEALVKGDNTIEGSALLKRNDGVAVTAAGETVSLIPVTPYASERMQGLFDSTERGYLGHPAGGPQRRVLNEHPDFYQYGKRDTTANAQGFFKFSNVKDGSYFIVTKVEWQPRGWGNRIQGGTLMLRVSVSDGETKEVVLTAR